jgi:hypothetical protein
MNETVKTTPTFPDEAHFQQLRSLLWSEAPRGRASVLVGAGVSRSATSLRPDGALMPLWRDLARKMAAEVWPGALDRRPGDALVLAEHYERLHQRTALDEFIRRSISDSQHVPSRVHALLLSLPWTDVFTTNYDTLLERAAQKVIERRYSLVLSQADLSTARQPRIVKLNGSLPSHRPFIITQEDFRTYPTSFAAFVNTVQQAIMETALCLLGFSGDDPNYQAWTGWVRDNLGSAAPPVYHCGVLDLDPARRSYMESRGVRPIDLGAMFPRDAWPDDSTRHSAALEWFILSLAEGAPPDLDSWPLQTRRKPSLPMMEVLSGVLSDPMRGRSRRLGVSEEVTPRSPVAWDAPTWLPPLVAPILDGSPSNEPRDESGVAVLARLRASYPGWVLCPTTTILEHIFSQAYAASAKDVRPSLVTMAHLAWAMSVLCRPWPDDFVTQVEEALERPGSVLTDADTLFLLKSLVREARERGDTGRQAKWSQYYASATKGNPVAVAEWQIERARQQLDAIEVEEAEHTLRGIVSQPGRPFLDVARAELLLEVGRFEDAATAAGTAVDQLRASNVAGSHQRLLGEEASAVDVALGASVAYDFGLAATGIGHPRRLELANSAADPRRTLKALGAAMREGPVSSESMRKEFDPGRWTKTVSHSFGSEHLRPFVYLRAIEASCQVPTNHATDVRFAAEAVAASRPAWAFSMLVRSGNSLGLAFDRQTILSLGRDSVDLLWARCEGVVRATMTAGWGPVAQDHNGLRYRAVALAIELMSRLTLRVEAAERAACLDVAILLHESTEFRQIWQLHDKLASLFARLFLVMSVDERASALLRLASLSIPETVPLDQAWVEPTLGFATVEPRLREHQSELLKDVERLIGTVRVGSSLAMSIAVTRLDALDRGCGLTAEDKLRFVEALWARGGANGIPIVRGFSMNLGLMVSAGRSDAQTRFRDWAVATPFPSLRGLEYIGNREVIHDQSHWVIRHAVSLERATLYTWVKAEVSQLLVDWTKREAEMLLVHAASCVLAAHDGWGRLQRINDERSREAMDVVGGFVASALVPRLSLTDGTRRTLERVDAALGAIGCRPLSQYPTWLLVSPTEDLGASLREGLTSASEEDARGSLQMLELWSGFALVGLLPDVPADLVDHVFLLGALAPPRARGSAFSTCRQLYLHDRRRLDSRRRGWVQVALERAFNPSGRAGTASNRDESQEGLQGDLRAAAAIMAITLNHYEPDSNAWQRLVASAESDPYPEVRQACEDARRRLPKPDGTSETLG